MQDVYQGQHELLGPQDGTIWHYGSAPRSSEIDPEDFFAAPVGSSQWPAITFGSVPTQVKPPARTGPVQAGLARQASNPGVADDNSGEGTLHIGIETAKSKLALRRAGSAHWPETPSSTPIRRRGRCNG